MSRSKTAVALLPTALKVSRSAEKQNATARLREVIEKTGLPRKFLYRGRELTISRLSSSSERFWIKQDLKQLKKRAKQERAAARESQLDDIKGQQAEQLEHLQKQPELFDPKVSNFGMEEKEALTLGALFGHQMGTPFTRLKQNIPKKYRRLVDAKREAQNTAREILDEFKEIWKECKPKNDHFLDEKFRELLAAVAAAEAKNEKLNKSEFVRALFDNWRKRFMSAVYRNKRLCKKIEDVTGGGLKVEETAAGTRRLVMVLESGGKEIRIQVDIDHAEMRLAEAVEMAYKKRRPELLRPIIDGESLQLATSRENSVVLEALRNQEFSRSNPVFQP